MSDHLFFISYQSGGSNAAQSVRVRSGYESQAEGSAQETTLVSRIQRLLANTCAQWTCLGARHDMQDEYGCDDIDKVWADLNFDIIFILFPVKVVPTGVDIEDTNVPHAVKDYPVDQQYLPKGLIIFDTIQIEYTN